MLDGLFLEICNMSFTASYLIVFVQLARFLLKKAPKKYAYSLWGVVLFRLLCPFSFESVFSIFQLTGRTTQQIRPFPSEVRTPPIPTPAQPYQGGGGEIFSEEPSIQLIFTLIWLIGMGIMLTYSLVQWHSLKRKLVGATPLRDHIYLADHIDSPFVMGVLKAKIYLPSNLSTGEQDFVLAHENCHIKRLDHIIRIIAFLALTLHWFNPFVWFAFIVSGKDMEMSCDEAVMKRMDTDIRIEYAQSLLRFAGGRRLTIATPLAFGEGDTKDRIKNVLKYKKPILWVSILAIIAVICMGFMLLSSPKPASVPKLDEAVSVQALWDNRTAYVGDNTAVGNILFQLSFSEDLIYDHFELETTEHPYEMKIYFRGINDVLRFIDDGNGVTQTVFNLNFNELEENAQILFALVGNLEKITFTIEREGRGTLTNHHTRDQYEDYFVRTATLEGFQSVLSEILDQKADNILEKFKEIPMGTTMDEVHQQFGQHQRMQFGSHGEIYLVGDKQVTITYEKQQTGGGVVKKVVIGDYTPTNQTADQAVVTALMGTSDGYVAGECFAEGHIILGHQQIEEGKTEIYAVTTVGWYGFENNHFVKISGSGIIPIVVTQDEQNAISLLYPKDGSQYNSSIQEMFPAEYHPIVMGNLDRYRDDLKEQEHQYASEYLSKLGRTAEIGETYDFEYISPTHVGISNEESYALQSFYKKHNHYPSYIGTRERLEGGKRVVYETIYHQEKQKIEFLKTLYDTKEVLQRFTSII